MQKGQAAIEFIFIILIIVMYLFTVTKPLIINAQGAIEDIENITKSNYELEKIIDKSNKLSLLGDGSKETLNIIVPNNSTFYCYDDKLGFKTTINKTGNNTPVGLCPNNHCDKNFPIINNMNFYCQITTLLPGYQELQLIKSSNKIIITR